jgi:hypothetical protein
MRELQALACLSVTFRHADRNGLIQMAVCKATDCVKVLGLLVKSDRIGGKDTESYGHQRSSINVITLQYQLQIPAYADSCPDLLKKTLRTKLVGKYSQKHKKFSLSWLEHNRKSSWAHKVIIFLSCSPEKLFSMTASSQLSRVLRM